MVDLTAALSDYAEWYRYAYLPILMEKMGYLDLEPEELEEELAHWLPPLTTQGAPTTEQRAQIETQVGAFPDEFWSFWLTVSPGMWHSGNEDDLAPLEWLSLPDALEARQRFLSRMTPTLRAEQRRDEALNLECLLPIATRDAQRSHSVLLDLSTTGSGRIFIWHHDGQARFGDPFAPSITVFVKMWLAQSMGRDPLSR